MNPAIRLISMTLSLTLLFGACSSGEPRSLLVVHIVEKSPQIPALDRIEVRASGISRSETGDVPQKIGLYLPPSVNGNVRARTSIEIFAPAKLTGNAASRAVRAKALLGNFRTLGSSVYDTLSG